MNGTVTTYVLHGKNVVHLTQGSNNLHFFYDTQNRPAVVVFNGTSYSYLHNLQGDIVAILDSNGNKVVEYKYDAWGKPISKTGSLASTLGTLNPFRYRGYVYDEETGLYNLQSRVYSPDLSRFINADGIIGATGVLLSHNGYSYCSNNPARRKDIGGAFFFDIIFDVASLVVSVIDVATNPTDPMAWVGLAGDVVDLIPGITGVGETVRAVNTGRKAADAVDNLVDGMKIVDKTLDTVQIAKAVDFTDDAADIVKTLDRSSGFTKSTARAGRKIHDGYKVGDGFNPKFKEYRKIRGVRPDYIDFDNKIIYELKPMNPRSVHSGIRQLQKYNKAFGGGFTLRLELY